MSSLIIAETEVPCSVATTFSLLWISSSTLTLMFFISLAAAI